MFCKLSAPGLTVLPDPVCPSNFRNEYEYAAFALFVLFVMSLTLHPFFLLIGSLFLFGCQSWKGRDLFQNQEILGNFQTYENDFGSRIEVFLKLAEIELLENYKRKKYLMIREDQPRQVVHPRKDLSLRELIQSAHADENISDAQKVAYLKKCDQLHELWEKHWRSADQKARQLGFDR